MRKIKHLSCHQGSRSQCTLRNSDSSFWHTHTAVTTHLFLFFLHHNFLKTTYFSVKLSWVKCSSILWLFWFLTTFPANPIPQSAKSINPPSLSAQTRVLHQSYPSFSALHPPLVAKVSLPCLYARYHLLCLPTGTTWEFLCSHLYARQSISYSSGFAFMRRPPCLLLNQPIKAEPFCKSHRALQNLAH